MYMINRHSRFAERLTESVAFFVTWQTKPTT
jgi:hypothetical protein